jgi:hypothetical protein
MSVPAQIREFLDSGLPHVWELDIDPWRCEFWAAEDLETFNAEYEVSAYAPGYFGFGSNGAGEMFAVSPQGYIVCLPFVGMSQAEEKLMAWSWNDFRDMLRSVA